MTDYTTPEGTTYSTTYNPGGFFTSASYSVTITDPDGSQTSVNGLSTSSVATSDNNVTSINLGSILGFGSNTAIVAPGAYANISFGGALSNNTLYIGGSATISGSISLGVSNTLNIDGGTASLGSGLVNGLGNTTVNLTYGGSFVAGSGFVNALGNTNVNFGPGGGTFLVNAGGAFLNLASTSITSFDKAGDFLEFQGLQSAATAYTVTNSGGNQVITLLSATGTTLTSVLVQGLNILLPPLGGLTGATTQDQPASPRYHTLAARNARSPQASSTPVYSVNGPGPLSVTRRNGNTYVEPVPSVCFLAGTPIEGVDGELLVENITVGDRVMAYENGVAAPRDVVWVGSRHVHARMAEPDPTLSLAPVRICRDAIADGVPSQDLLVTPEHCMFLDGAFTPARMLVNGVSIFYDRTIASYTYFHVETARHSVIKAAGALTESYLDTGNRAGFTGADARVTAIGTAAGTDVAPSTWSQDAAAPLAVGRAHVERLHQAIAARAGIAATAPALESDAGFHLVTQDGRALRPTRTVGDVAVFALPEGATSVRLVSHADRPSDAIGPFVDDRRCLGVLIGAITQWGSGQTRQIDTHLGTDGLEGWHAREAADMRWTDGNAVLPLLPTAPGDVAMLSVRVIDHAACRAVTTEIARAA